MSEELTLLPCYKCGGIAIHSYYDKYPKGLEPLIIDKKTIREGKVWHFVKCEKCGEQRSCLHPKCSVEAIKEWNALPRALTWTTEPPKVEGLYYQRWNWDGHWGDADVITVEQRSVDKIRKNADRQWAGPIPTPMPKEPRP